jgi:hypothetical protein
MAVSWWWEGGVVPEWKAPKSSGQDPTMYTLAIYILNVYRMIAI